MQPWTIAAAWVGVASLVAFVLCVFDKSRARRGAARIRERTLLGWAFVGGSPGLLLGMVIARHKTRKAAFLLPLGVILLAQAALAWWLLA